MQHYVELDVETGSQHALQNNYSKPTFKAKARKDQLKAKNEKLKLRGLIVSIKISIR